MSSKFWALGIVIMALGGGYFFMFTKDTSYCSFLGTRTVYGREACRWLGGKWVSETTYPQEGTLIMMLGIVIGVGGSLFSKPKTMKVDFVNICPNCDTILPENSQFCSSCGKNILLNESA